MLLSPHLRFFSVALSQSSPSYRPSPVVAHVAWMYQFRDRSECRPSLSVTSAAVIAFKVSEDQKTKLAECKKAMGALQKEVRAGLAGILTAEQKAQLKAGRKGGKKGDKKKTE